MLLSEKFFKMIVFFLRFLLLVFLFFCFTSVTFAQVEITEIMYDFEEGSDSGREWVEIHNVGGGLVDISDWRFFEAETNHKLKIISGDGALSVGEYAIIVSDDVKFYIDNPTFSGDVLDSSFSLRQKDDIGEELVIRDQDENDIDSVTYDPLWGAKGDGNSLQKVNGSWCAGAPTPGATNIFVCARQLDDDSDPSPADGQEDDDEDIQESSETYSDTMPSRAEEPKISTYAGAAKRIMIAGASIDFEGKSFGTDGKILPYARHVWSFGDGSRGEGKEITHTYYYPGEYVVVLNTTSGGYSATDRVFVEIIPADILINNVFFDEPSFIEIYNKTSYELDLSRWQLKVGEWKFTIPQDTFIRAKRKIIFPSRITKLSLKEGDEISLLYPSGEIVTTYKEKEKISLINKIESEKQEAQLATQPASDYIEEKVVNKDAVSNNSFSHNTVKSEESSALSYIDIEDDDEKPAFAQGYGEAKKETIVPDVKNTAQEARALGGVNSQNKNKQEDGLFWGIMGVSLLSLIAIYGVLVSKEKKNSFQTKNEAGLYDIIEIKD